MVSFQFRQGINVIGLNRHQNGTIKHFKSETEHQKSKTLTYEFLKRKSRAKKRFQSFNGM